MTQEQLCNAVHKETGATCELWPHHPQNHRGHFEHGVVQWPYDAQVEEPKEALTDTEVEHALQHGLRPLAEAHWRAMAADTVHQFWFTNREAAVLFAEIDRLRASEATLRATLGSLVERMRGKQHDFASKADELDERGNSLYANKLAAASEATAIWADELEQVLGAAPREGQS